MAKVLDSVMVAMVVVMIAAQSLTLNSGEGDTRAMAAFLSCTRPD